MMLYPSLPSLLEKINSRYMLVNVIAARARQIAENAEENSIHLDEKPVSMAIEEIANDTLHISCDNQQ